MSKKDLAIGFLKTVVARKVLEAYQQYVAPDFIHHNTHSKGDRQSLLDAMVDAHNHFPDTMIDIKHIYEDGDAIITHSLVQLRPQGPDVAVVHIMRFKGDKIVELWDVGVPIDPKSPNENGPF